MVKKNAHLKNFLKFIYIFLILQLFCSSWRECEWKVKRFIIVDARILVHVTLVNNDAWFMLELWYKIFRKIWIFRN